MIVRGMLWQHCKGWLGVYESHLAGTRKSPLKRKVLESVDQYGSQIEAHFQFDTGETYVRINAPMSPPNNMGTLKIRKGQGSYRLRESLGFCR
jgi:hypothetical protein